MIEVTFSIQGDDSYVCDVCGASLRDPNDDCHWLNLHVKWHEQLEERLAQKATVRDGK
jgi:hypothetical protein